MSEKPGKSETHIQAKTVRHIVVDSAQEVVIGGGKVTVSGTPGGVTEKVYSGKNVQITEKDGKRVVIVDGKVIEEL